MFALRDDIVCGGTKVRALHHVITKDPRYANALSFGYHSSRYGSAQIVLAWTGRRLGKPVYLQEKESDWGWTRKPGILHPNDELARQLGARFVEHYGYKTVEMPSGFKSFAVIHEIEAYARRVRDAAGGSWRTPAFDQLWCVVATGTLVRGLQRSGIARHYHCVNVYPDSGIALQLASENLHNITVHRHKVDIDVEESDDLPPFSSNVNYDAKAWSYAIAAHLADPEQRILFWNVAANYIKTDKESK
jgi:hypothetical protein